MGVITKWRNRKDWKDTEQYPHHNTKANQQSFRRTNKHPFKGITSSPVIFVTCRSCPPHPAQPTFLFPVSCLHHYNSSTCKHLNIILFKSALYYNSFEFTPFAGFLPKAKPPINVVGDVAGKIAIIIVSF